MASRRHSNYPGVLICPVVSLGTSLPHYKDVVAGRVGLPKILIQRQTYPTRPLDYSLSPCSSPNIERRSYLSSEHESSTTTRSSLSISTRLLLSPKYTSSGSNATRALERHEQRSLERHEQASMVDQRMPVFFTQAVEPSTSHHQDKNVAIKSLIKTASYCYSAHGYSQMIDLLLKAMKHIESDTPVTILSAVYFGLGIAHFKLKHHEDATAFFLKTNILGENNDIKGDVCLANYYLAESEYLQSKFLPASAYYTVAIENYFTVSIGEVYRVEMPTLSLLYCRQANSFRYGSKIMEAVVLYNKAIGFARSGRDAGKDELSARTSLGNLYQGIGDYGNAISEYEKAIKLTKDESDYMTLAWSYGNIGNAYLGQNQPEVALKHLLESLTLTLAHEPTPQAIGRAYNNLGTAYQALNDLDKAKEYYLQSLDQAIYGNDLPGQARVQGNLGNLHMIKGQFSEAIRCYTDTLSISRDRATQTTAYHNRGCARYEQAEINRKRQVNPEVAQNSPGKGKSMLIFMGAAMTECEAEHQFVELHSDVRQGYRDAKNDLEKVKKHHEQTFQDIKGSKHGLSLSVSLFETHSKTFCRLQDCSYYLGEWQQALVYAEESRARTLGELMLKKITSLSDSFRTPLDLPLIVSIVKNQKMPVVYLSYTGTRLLVWVLVPAKEVNSEVSINMFQVNLSPSQFNGKPFDHMVRYSLTESLTNKRIEMYGTCNYEEPTLLNDLYELIIKPLKRIFKTVLALQNIPEFDEVILIPDTHTKLLPMAALQDPDTHEFLGDNLRFLSMHSLLTMGTLLNQKSVIVSLPKDAKNMCIVGNPTIPRFQYKKEEWNLGRLPFATEEAEWVSHIVGASPILHEEATKQVVINKLKKATVVHLATHGSASIGFLVFAAAAATGSSPVDSKVVLLFPNEIETLKLPAALVVLSSCDSGRGALKAEGIQGIARSFLLAGAQTVLTSLWRVPDESASFFMQFFYRYLVDGIPSPQALQKATLSVRCFVKYGDYIHWSGYQLIGREIKFENTKSGDLVKCGDPSPFPRLNALLCLEKNLILQARPSIQLVVADIGLNAQELVSDYVIKYRSHYTGGIYWLNGYCDDALNSGVQCMAECLLPPPFDEGTIKGLEEYMRSISPQDPVLVVLDNIKVLPIANSIVLSSLARRPQTHFIVMVSNVIKPATIIDDARQQLDLVCELAVNLKPLTAIQSAQRIVYHLMSNFKLCPLNEEQHLFEDVADLVRGCPYVINLVCCSIESFINRVENVKDGMREFTREVIEKTWVKLHRTVSEFTTNLLLSFKLAQPVHLLLCCLSLVGGGPFQLSFLEELQKYLSKIGSVSGRLDLIKELKNHYLLLVYPCPVIGLPSKAKLSKHKANLNDLQYFYVPDIVCKAVYRLMEHTDRVIACGIMHKFLASRTNTKMESYQLHLKGIHCHLLEAIKKDFSVFNKDIYEVVMQGYKSK